METNAVSTQDFGGAKSVELTALIAYFRGTLGHNGPLTVHWCLCRSQVGEYGGKAELGANRQIVQTMWSEGDVGSDGQRKERVKAPVLALKNELPGIVEIRKFDQCNVDGVGEHPPRVEATGPVDNRLAEATERRRQTQVWMSGSEADVLDLLQQLYGRKADRTAYQILVHAVVAHRTATTRNFEEAIRARALRMGIIL
jgi:hypothetical protein